MAHRRWHGGGSASRPSSIWPLHVFDDDDGVVDHQAGGQRDAEEGERIDGEAEDLDERKGADQRDRDGDGGDDGGAPVLQEQEDDDDDDDDGFAQRADDFADGIADDRGGVEGDRHTSCPGGKDFDSSARAALRFSIDLERIGVGELLHADTDGVDCR